MKYVEFLFDCQNVDSPDVLQVMSFNINQEYSLHMIQIYMKQDFVYYDNFVF